MCTPTDRAGVRKEEWRELEKRSLVWKHETSAVRPSAPVLVAVSMDEVDYSSRLAELEAQELQADDQPSEKLYAQMLALYILTDDLTSAKFLWMRVPAGIRTENEDLHTIWTIAVHLIKRTPAAVYFLIREREWPPHVKNIMVRIADRVRDQQISLISNAYSDISLSEMTRLTGCGSEEESTKLAHELGWIVDQGTVHPRKGRKGSGGEEERQLSQEQLQKLTEYVAFLENH